QTLDPRRVAGPRAGSADPEPVAGEVGVEDRPLEHVARVHAWLGLLEDAELGSPEQVARLAAPELLELEARFAEQQEPGHQAREHDAVGLVGAADEAREVALDDLAV